MNVIVERKRTMFGKRTKLFTARLPFPAEKWTEEAATKEDAKLKLLNSLRDEEEYRFARHYIAKPGAMFCLYFGGGWCYDIVRTENPSKPSSTMLSVASFPQALEAMQKHAANWEA